jgi:peptidyl-dipeptidase Dcp
MLVAMSAVALPMVAQTCAAAELGASNPFHAPSSLPFSAPPFDRIKDHDYQPAIEAGMRAQLTEIRHIAENPAPPTFENTFVAMERSGRLLRRARAAFNAVSEANINPTLQKAKTALAPQIAAHADAIHLNAKLFERLSVVYRQRAELKLDPESLRLVEVTYDEFIHAGANLSAADQAQLKRLNEEESALGDAFSNKLLAATQQGAFSTPDRTALAGLTDAQLAAASQAAAGRGMEGFLVPLQNTTQQPVLQSRDPRGHFQQLLEPRRAWRCQRHTRNDRAPGAAPRAARATAGFSEPRRVETGRPDGQDAAGRDRFHGRACAGGHREGRR